MPEVHDIFSTWDSIVDAARAFDLPYHAVAKWHQRGRIPARYWPRIIAAAAREGRKLTADDLMRIAASES